MLEDVNHLNFFNTDFFDDLLDIPNDSKRGIPNLKRYGTPPPYLGLLYPHLRVMVGTFQGTNASASEGDRSVDLEDTHNILEGDYIRIHSQEVTPQRSKGV
ncbi:hypothetical protein Tco_0872896 [Tanacetum coccineum]